MADVSPVGCRLRGIGLPGVGHDVLLKVDDVELFGHIVWEDEEERGVKFDQPISDADLEELRKLLARQVGQDSIGPDLIPPEGRRKPPPKG